MRLNKAAVRKTCLGVVIRPLAALLLLSVVGCGGMPERPAGDNSLLADREMFAAGYENIEMIYIEPVDPGTLTMAGLERLSTIDPELSVKRTADSVILLVDRDAHAVFETPAHDDGAAWGILTANIVDSARSVSPHLRGTSSEALYETMFEGILSSLDGVSRYASATEAFENRVSREGFGGIGIRIAVGDDAVRVVSVMHYTPAERAGLRADDVISHINGLPVDGLDQDAVVDLLRGPVGTPVDLEVRHSGAKTSRAVAVTRAHIVPETVVYRREGDIAYLRVYSFNLETAQSLRKELIHARADVGDDLEGFVLDLRGNPGGLLDQAVAVADLFLERGRIVSTHGRHPDSHQYFEASGGDYGDGLPIVVLINGNSASAAEIVAAALQDSGRGVVIGSNSYGKGTVQTVLRMPNQGELTLTWARFHAPSGYTLHHLGVLPSICTNSADNTASHLIGALRGGRLVPVPTVLRNAADPEDTSGLDRLRAACPLRKVEEAVDLQVALALLEEPALYERAIHLADPPKFTVSTQPALSQAQP
ncbi:S41 family peptidase [Rhodospirillaceae bacterium SYSU D60014]|uniref:S41 family peptidase n=1 Tax=Virgifigura deserti TaxID=2268457 RepID=UPI000E660C36